MKIGSKTVIGAGRLVTRDIPDGVIAAGNPCQVIREITEYRLSSLHLMGSTFAADNVSRFLGAFALTSLRLPSTAGVGANPVAADALFFGRSDKCFLTFIHHYQVPLG